MLHIIKRLYPGVLTNGASTGYLEEVAITELKR